MCPSCRRRSLARSFVRKSRPSSTERCDDGISRAAENAMTSSAAGHIRTRLLLTVGFVLGATVLASFVNDVDSRSVYRNKTRDEQSDNSQLPLKDAKPQVRKNTLLRSAWIIIAIVLTIVLGAMAVYYWILFYPILCKKERKYDVMQMSAKP